MLKIGQKVVFNHCGNYPYKKDFIYCGLDIKPIDHQAEKPKLLLCTDFDYARDSWETVTSYNPDKNLALILPDIHQLTILYELKDIIGCFRDYFYWSSTEDTIDTAIGIHFGNGKVSTGSKQRMCYVRYVYLIAEETLRQKSPFSFLASYLEDNGL
jgi:hypothetical protein